MMQFCGIFYCCRRHFRLFTTLLFLLPRFCNTRTTRCFLDTLISFPKGDGDEVAEVHALLEGGLPMFIQSGDLEVQERVRIERG